MEKRHEKTEGENGAAGPRWEQKKRSPPTGGCGPGGSGEAPNSEGTGCRMLAQKGSEGLRRAQKGSEGLRRAQKGSEGSEGLRSILHMGKVQLEEALKANLEVHSQLKATTSLLLCLVPAKAFASGVALKATGLAQQASDELSSTLDARPGRRLSLSF